MGNGLQMLLRIVVNKFFIILFFAVLSLFSCSDSTQYVVPPVDKLTESEKEQLCDGDVILRRGSGFVSGFIVSSFGETYPISHCGIVCREGDSIYVIHSISKELAETSGVQSCSIDDFVGIALPNSVIVTRLKYGNNHLIADEACKYLEKKVGFDYGFNSKDSSELFCSELIRDAIRNVYHINLFKDDSHANVGFKSFYDTAYFYVIINHHDRVL